MPLNQETKLFCVKYLNPKAKLSPGYDRSFDPFETLVQEASKLDWVLVHKLIRNLNYDNYFTETLYWKIIAAHVKQRDSFVCQRCGKSHEKMEAHHRTYAHHGSEHYHLDDLETLCPVCHRVQHGQLVEAAVTEWELDDSMDFRSFRLFADGILIPHDNRKREGLTPPHHGGSPHA